MSQAIRLALLASGNGTNVISIIHNVAQSYSDKIKVELVLSDQKNAPVISKMEKFKIPTYVVEKKTTKKIQEFEILKILKNHRVDWICLAGFMRILSGDFLTAFNQWHANECQVVNIHPSLLPLYPGLESIERAYKDQVSESGVTLHFVDSGIDTGNILYQKKVVCHRQETLNDFKTRIHEAEYVVYENFLNNLATSQIKTYFFKDV